MSYAFPSSFHSRHHAPCIEVCVAIELSAGQLVLRCHIGVGGRLHPYPAAARGRSIAPPRRTAHQRHVPDIELGRGQGQSQERRVGARARTLTCKFEDKRWDVAATSSNQADCVACGVLVSRRINGVPSQRHASGIDLELSPFPGLEFPYFFVVQLLYLC